MSDTEKKPTILELEAKIEVLQQENSQLAERSEDSLLLGLVSEKTNSITNVTTLLDWVLEHISILKDIPFCACGRLHLNELKVKNYYYSVSNTPLKSTTSLLPDNISQRIAASAFQVSGDECQIVCSFVKFNPKDFSPTSLFFVPTKSSFREQELFCFAITDSSQRLSAMRHLLERIVEIISSRIDNISLMAELKGLNQSLDTLVQERTKELHDTNTVFEKSEAKFRSLFNDANDMMHILDASGKIVDANPMELKTLKYSREEFIGRHLFDLIAPESKENTANALKKILTGKEITGLHTTMLAQDGSRVLVEVNVVPELIDGKVVRIRAILRNITDRTQQETSQLKLKKLESVGVLAGGIAHDFNNILAAILGNIELAKLYSSPEGKIFPLLEEAGKASLRAKELTQQLLTFAKGGDPVKQLTSIIDVIEESALFVVRGSKLRCEFNFDKDLWPVAIDPGQISQVVQNLIINARQATTSNGQIDVTGENFLYKTNHLPLKAGRYIKITVRDQGKGIAPELLDKIFDPYFSTKKEGSGLGLAVTHSIIRKHQGHIEVTSTPSLGTIFTIFLPAERPQETIAKKETRSENVSCSGRIVIMDDDEMIRSMTKAMLTKFGHEVIPASDGEEAITTYKNEFSSENPIDIVIMDLTIPGGMGGKEAAQEILKIDPAAKLIVSSGYSNDPVMANCQKYGFSAAISKPYQLQNLVEVIGRVMAQ